MGYRWMKCQSRRKVLIEQPTIATWRANYIRDIKKFRQEGRNIVYIDETGVHKTHVVPKCWQPNEEIGVTKTIGKGSRLIIIHAGGESGFVALKIWQAKKSKRDIVSQDFHDDMDFNSFFKWINECLLPNLPPHSVLVMDNASYHNKEDDKKPSSANLKKNAQEWLKRHNITLENSMTTPQLLSLAILVPVQKTYSIDKVILEAGHSVVRLSPYHADLNPIELVWGDIKGRVGECLSESMKDKKQLCLKLLREFSDEKWKNCCEHVYKLEDNYSKLEGIVENAVKKFIININRDTDSSDSDSVQLGSEDECKGPFEDDFEGVRVLSFDQF